MTEPKSWEEWQAWLAQPVPRTIINEPIEPEPETARERADRRWRRTESESGNDHSLRQG
jgi:hypothetical protein